MRPFHVLLMLTTLLATATTVNAQSTSSPAPPPLPEAVQKSKPAKLVEPPQGARYDTPGYPKAAFEKVFDGGANSDNGVVGGIVLNERNMEDPARPAMMAPWCFQVLQQSAATWQRLRAICSTPKQDSACCEGASAKAAGCAIGVAGSVKSCAGAQAPTACACAKACACCEACKEKAETTPRVQAQPTPLTAEMMERMAGLRGIAQLQPTPPPFPVIGVPPCLPPAHGAGIVQIVPVPGVRVVQVMQITHHAKPVHLVTPDLEAHCERMHHRGDMVVLEGNVLLLCKKHAQPIRVEAQRIIVNMRDGSFTVDSDVRPVSTSSFGVQRTSAVRPATQMINGRNLIVNTKDGSLSVEGADCIDAQRALHGLAPAAPSNVGYSVPVPCLRECPASNWRTTPSDGEPSNDTIRSPSGPRGASEPQRPTIPPDLEALFRFWTEMYR